MVVVGLCVSLGLVWPRGRAALGRYRTCYERDVCTRYVYRKNEKRKPQKNNERITFHDLVIRCMRVSVVSRTSTCYNSIGVVSVGSTERGDELGTPRI